MMVPSTLVIDRRFRGVGRIKRASGTKVPAMKRRLERMLESLYSEGRLDLLRLIRDGNLTLLEVHDAYQRKALAQLPTGQTVAPLVATMRAWVDSLRVPTDYIDVYGTKREGRVRSVPLIQSPAVPTWKHPRTFENAFRERTSAFTPYDLRRTYSNWLEAAGIPRTRRRMYMGHGARDVTDLYEQHEVTAFLVEDGAKLRAFLGIQTVGALPLKVAK